jgi:ribonuclease Z
MLDVCLLGTGGMMPLPNRYLTSLLTRCNGSSLLIDCGEGTQVALRNAGWSFNPIDTILITHFHGDHVSGLPGLLLSMGNADRTEPVTIIGPKGLEKVVRSLCVIAPELPFDINFIEMNDAEETFIRGDYNITAFKVNHNITCYGYSIEIKRAGRFDPELAKANDVPLKYWNRLQKGEEIEADGRVFTQNMILGPARKGIKLTYATDSRPCPSITKNAKGSDLLILEGMYGEPGSEQRAAEHRHMNFAEAATIALRSKAEELWLTHYSPAMAKPELYKDYVRGIFANTKICRDGRKVTLEFSRDE